MQGAILKAKGDLLKGLGDALKGGKGGKGNKGILFCKKNKNILSK